MGLQLPSVWRVSPYRTRWERHDQVPIVPVFSSEQSVKAFFKFSKLARKLLLRFGYLVAVPKLTAGVLFKQAGARVVRYH